MGRALLDPGVQQLAGLAVQPVVKALQDDLTEVVIVAVVVHQVDEVVEDLEFPQQPDPIFAGGEETEPRNVLAHHGLRKSALRQQTLFLRSLDRSFLRFVAAIGGLPGLVEDCHLSLQQVAHFLEEGLLLLEDVIFVLNEGETEHEEDARRGGEGALAFFRVQEGADEVITGSGVDQVLGCL